MSEVETEDQTEDERPQPPPEAESDLEEVPERVTDDWLDQKPFDPAGR